MILSTTVSWQSSSLSKAGQEIKGHGARNPTKAPPGNQVMISVYEPDEEILGDQNQMSGRDLYNFLGLLLQEGQSATIGDRCLARFGGVT